mmetsp:Transcript_80713/g.140819  ORF Transcript_80713/g.140819 Transcript_80713/m.140819 type:complete len:571 (+) Transcript_80713:64-1776(+)
MTITKQAAITVLFLCIFATSPALGSKKFLADDSKHTYSSKTFHKDIMTATGFMLGCGGEVTHEHLASIEKALLPMWHTLPKNNGRIDRRSLRYLVHRHFMQTSSLMIRGFEPTRPVNDSHWGVADILSQQVPAYVESALESSHAKQKGFTLQDAVHMVVMLEQLVFDSETALLTRVYADQRKPLERSLSHGGLKQILEAYMVYWMVEGDPAEIAAIMSNRTLIEEIVPHYRELVNFAEGRIRTLQFTRDQDASASFQQGHGRNLWSRRYSFEDAHEIVGGITHSFQSYWQSECESMKASLVQMDTHNTGRVPLSRFYGTGLDSDWRFGESESYLRELGALDETSSWRGPQVIIPNYIQATSNCIVAAPHYRVCCVAECENLQGEIEVAIGSPTALPSEILSIVRNMTSQTTLDHDDPPHLEKDLIKQLEQVASTHGGMVPLHGRLFAQWLHYVFPRECPFPHKIGMVSSVTPDEYGASYIASHEEMKKHASNAAATVIDVSVAKEELQWMSQWSPDEEFVVDYSAELRSAWEWRLLLAIVGVGLLVAGVYSGVVGTGKSKEQSFTHSHFV